MKRVDELSRSSAAGGGSLKTKRCGCVSPPRRTCPTCNLTDVVFLACSHACLEKHQRDAHGGASSSRTEAVDHIADVNAHGHDWDAFTGHRDRLTRIVTAAQRGDGLCVLGAGYGLDLDLPKLVRAFGEVHLVDVDARALDAARARVPEPCRSRIVLHGGIDLTGCLDQIDVWGDRFPNLATRSALVNDVPAQVAARLGRTFDVVMSACVLTQLGLPFQETLVLAPSDWQLLLDMLYDLHAATMSALLRAGGTGLLATEVASSRRSPAPFAGVEREPDPTKAEPSAIAQGATVADRLAATKVTPTPDPNLLVRRHSQAPLAQLTERARLLPPWVWHAGTTAALVVGLLFQRSEEG